MLRKRMAAIIGMIGCIAMTTTVCEANQITSVSAEQNVVGTSVEDMGQWLYVHVRASRHFRWEGHCLNRRFL